MTDLLCEINRTHCFAVQFDRRNGRDTKTYEVGSPAFTRYLEEATGYLDAGKGSFTDICTLCDPIDGPAFCGANVSVGYYDEHDPDERLVVGEWLHTLAMARRWLSTKPLPSFRRPRRGQPAGSGRIAALNPNR